MAEIGGKVSFDISEVQKNLPKIIELFNDLGDASEGMTDEMKSSLKDVQKALDGFGKETKDAAKEVDKLNKEQKESVAVLKESAKEFKLFGVSLDDVTSKLAKWRATQKAVTAAMGGTTKALKLFRVALISTGVGAIVVALGSMVTFLTKTQRGMDRLNVAMAKITGPIKVVSKGFYAIGEALLDLRNPLKAVRDLFSGSGGIVNAMKEASKAATQLEKDKIKLRDAQRNLSIETAKSRAEIEKLKKISDDTTKSTKERIKATQDATAMEQNLLTKREEQQRLLIQQLKTEKEKIATDEDNIKLLDKIAEAEIALADIQKESTTLSIELQNKENALLDEKKRKLEEIANQLDSGLDVLRDALEKQELEDLTPFGRFLREGEKELKEFEKLRDELLPLAKQLGRPIEDLEVVYDKVIANIKKKIDEGIEIFQQKASRDPEENKILELLGFTDIDTLEVPVGEVKLTPKTDSVVSKKTLKELFSNIEDFFLSEEFQAGEAAFNAVTDAFTAGIDVQIAKIDELLAKQDEKVSRLQDDLDKEKEFAKEGLASKAETLEEELRVEEEKREQALKKRDELEKKRQKLQLAQLAVQQAQSLGTAVAQIFTAYSSIPFVGIALAVAQIASMYTAFAKAKAQASSLSKLATGTQEGPIGHYARGKGADDRYSVIETATGRDTGVRVGPDEDIMRPEISREHGALLRDMNKNPWKYRGRNLSAELFDVGVGGSVLEGYGGIEQLDKSELIASANKASVNRANYLMNSAISKEDLKQVMTEVLAENRGAEQTYDMNKKETHYLTDDVKKIVRTWNNGKNKETINIL